MPRDRPPSKAERRAEFIKDMQASQTPIDRAISTAATNMRAHSLGQITIGPMTYEDKEGNKTTVEKITLRKDAPSLRSTPMEGPPPFMGSYEPQMPPPPGLPTDEDDDRG